MAEPKELYNETITATASGPTIDTLGFSEADIECNVGTASGTTPTLEVSIQHSPDTTDGNFTELALVNRRGLFKRFTASAQRETISVKGFQRYVRARLIVGGTSPSFSTEIAGVFR